MPRAAHAAGGLAARRRALSRAPRARAHAPAAAAAGGCAQEMDEEPKLFCHLLQCQLLPFVEVGKEHAFGLWTPLGGGEELGVQLLLHADSAIDRYEWLEAIEEHLELPAVEPEDAQVRRGGGARAGRGHGRAAFARRRPITRAARNPCSRARAAAARARARRRRCARGATCCWTWGSASCGTRR